MFQEMGATISREIGRYWWTGAVRGALLIVLGLVALLAPRIALLALIYTFGIFAIVDGIVAIIAALGRRQHVSGWGWSLVGGILGIIIGILAIVWPGETGLILLFFVAAWAIIHGIMQLGSGFSLRHLSSFQVGALVLSGIVSILFGLILFIFPAGGIFALLWVLGIYGLVAGILSIIHAFQLRAIASHVQQPGGAV
jgi:Uncharacterized conserved protein